jgi:hypothetical protein
MEAARKNGHVEVSAPGALDAALGGHREAVDRLRTRVGELRAVPFAETPAAGIPTSELIILLRKHLPEHCCEGCARILELIGPAR